MDLSNLKPKTKRVSGKRIGRGGKRGTTSGAGTKGQKSRSGKGITPGFRGGDNRIWQLFPKQRGATSRPGSKRPHRKQRYAKFPNRYLAPVNLSDLRSFKEGETVSPQTLTEKGLIRSSSPVKILGFGQLGKKLTFKDVMTSASAKTAIEKAGGTIE
jgi:large subunit ribosomal protein L15